MNKAFAVSDADLARARRDPAFKQQLLTSTLDHLLAELNRQQKSPHPDPDWAVKIRAAGQLAARIADIIRDLDGRRAPPAETSAGMREGPLSADTRCRPAPCQNAPVDI